MLQTKTESLIESCINVFIGFWVSFLANAIILPLVGLPVSISQNIIIGLGMTIVSVARSYILRRVCQKYLRDFVNWIGSYFRKEVV